MAVTLTTAPTPYPQILCIDDGQSLRIVFSVVVSGTYTAGSSNGEDLATILADERVKSSKAKLGQNLAFYCQSQNGTNPNPMHGTTRFRFWTAAGTELAGGAYAAAYTGDVIRVELSTRKYV